MARGHRNVNWNDLWKVMEALALRNYTTIAKSCQAKIEMTRRVKSRVSST